MKIILVINNREITLNDSNVLFEEGEQIEVTGEYKNYYKVHTIHKLINVVGDSSDLSYKVILK